MKRRFIAARKSAGILCIGWAILLSGTRVFAQDAPPNTPSAVAQPSEPNLLSPDQLDNLLAPIALYPDPLLSQVLAASTYPLEIVEAQQWVQQNRNLQGRQLLDAAHQQSWDPSVQALVAFPDVLSLLNRDVQWTTDLGNAFLAQQKDVMAAVQRMRVRAEQNGKLTSTAQQTVTTQAQDGQSAVVIQPADPQVIYVPAYNPAYVWGPPVWGYYPPLWYPGISFGFGFGPGIYLNSFFPGWGVGWGGWGLGWGWGCGWFGGGLYVNSFFFNHYGFYHGGYYGGRFAAGGRNAWVHDSFHREGVPYANRSVAARFNNSRFAAGRYNGGSSFSAARSSVAGGSRSFNGSQSFRNTGSPASRGFAPSNRTGANNSSSRSYSSQSSPRSYSAPSYNRSYSNPGTTRSYSAPSYNRGYSNPGSTRSYSAPSYNRSYANPGATRSYSAPSYNRSYSNPGTSSRGFSSPRSSGGGSRSPSGGVGGHSSGGGSRGRR